jgi:putative component of toxin-antitoxin plasmid stabilization module
MLRVLQYQTANGRAPLPEWLDGLADRQARTRILGRIDRLSGTQRTQAKDIEKAHGYWKDYKARAP